MLQDIGEHVFHNEFTPRAARPDDFALCYAQNMALLLSGDTPRLMRFSDFEDPALAGAHAEFLFTIDGRGFFLLRGYTGAFPAGCARYEAELFRTLQPDEMGFAGILGMQLDRFYRDNAFCGRCGAPMRKSEKERALCCPSCALTVYPRLSPAVIVGVVDGEKLLLTRYAGRSYKKYALVAGYAEFGETIEQTVRREVMEEVGLRVRDIRYFQSQPWPFSDSLLFGFFCRADSGSAIRLQQDELSEAAWFTREALPPTENTKSLTNTMIEAFRAGAW